MKHLLTSILLLASLVLPVFLVAQEGETTEPPPTFLEVMLESHELTFTPPTWTWTLIPEHDKAFEIEITSPSIWASAHLCVDGNSLKTIKSGKNHFKWSFANLKPGTHTVTLLVIDAQGNAGTASRRLN